MEKPKPVQKPAPKPAPAAAPTPAPSPEAVEGPVAQAGQAGLAEGREGGVGTGVSGSGSGASDGTDQVLAELLAVVEANKTYPRRARQTGQQGEVLLAVEIGPDGRVVSVTIRKKHASALLTARPSKPPNRSKGVPQSSRRRLPSWCPFTLNCTDFCAGALCRPRVRSILPTSSFLHDATRTLL